MLWNLSCILSFFPFLFGLWGVPGLPVSPGSGLCVPGPGCSRPQPIHCRLLPLIHGVQPRQPALLIIRDGLIISAATERTHRLTRRQSRDWHWISPSSRTLDQIHRQVYCLTQVVHLCLSCESQSVIRISFPQFSAAVHFMRGGRWGELLLLITCRCSCRQ